MLLRRLSTYAPPLLVGLLAVPFLVRQNSWWEWNNAFWLLERQTAHVEAHGVPTLFVHALSGGFNPFFAYYAGFVFSVLAYPAAVLGVWPVFAATVVLAIVAGYLGIWWAARNLGLSPHLAVLPALVFSTTPYVLSEMYGRGAWAELIAVNAVAVLLGGLTALLWHPERGRIPAYAAVVAATATICGTHNLTVMMSAVLLPLLLLVVLPLRPPASPPLLPQLARAAVAAALGAGLTAAWLIPNLWFGRSTWIAQPAINDPEFRDTHGLLTLHNVLSPLPAIPKEFAGRWIYGQAPATAMAWALVAFVLILVLGRRDARRAGVAIGGMVVLAIGLLALILNPEWWLHLPSLARTVQFPYRLLPYLAMLAALGTVLGLVVLRGAARSWMTGILVALVVVQAGAGVYVVVKTQPGGVIPVVPARPSDLEVSSEPLSFSGPEQMVHVQFRVASPTDQRPTRGPVNINLGDVVTGDTGRFSGVARVGDLMMSPVVWSPFVRVTGDARIGGRDANGMTMIEVTSTDAAGRWQAQAVAAHPWQLVVGRIISALSALALVGAGAAALVARRRGRRSGAAARADTPVEQRATVGV